MYEIDVKHLDQQIFTLTGLSKSVDYTTGFLQDENGEEVIIFVVMIINHGDGE